MTGSINYAGPGRGGLFPGLIRDCQRAWGGISGFALYLIIFSPLLILLGGIVTALMGKAAYKFYTGEDQFAETLQILFFSGALIFSVMIIKQLWRINLKFIAALYGVVVLGLFFLVGEEISWGQRIFGWETSAEMSAINKQQETNLHNIHGVDAAFKWIQFLIGVYGTFLPLLVTRIRTTFSMNRFLSFVVPHYSLILYFLPLFLFRIYRNLYDPPKRYYFVISEYNEVLELCLAVGMFCFMYHQWKRLREGRI